MKSKLVVLAVALIVATISIPGIMATGNGATSGAHYNLNLIGKAKTDILPNDYNSGHRIFVNLEAKSKIYLTQGEFDVTDADATDGRGGFQLPAPNTVIDPNTGEVASSAYRVYVRVVGKPGGTGSLVTCGYTYDLTGTEIDTCSMEIVPLASHNGKPVFDDVTKELTTVLYDPDGSGPLLPVRVNIFDDEFAGYLWQLDNNGMKVIQLRFYQTS